MNRKNNYRFVTNGFSTTHKVDVNTYSHRIVLFGEQIICNPRSSSYCKYFTTYSISIVLILSQIVKIYRIAEILNRADIFEIFQIIILITEFIRIILHLVNSCLVRHVCVINSSFSMNLCNNLQ